MAGGTGRMIRRLVGAGGGGGGAGGGGGGGIDGSGSKKDLIAAAGGGGGAGKVPSSSSWRSRRRKQDKSNGCGDPDEPAAATVGTEGESSPSSAVSASHPQLALVTPLSSRGDHDTVCSLSSGGTSAMTADPTPQCIGGGNGGGSDVPSSRPAAAACTPGNDRGERERAGDGGNQNDNNDDKDDAAASPTNDGELTSQITSDFRHLLEHGSFPGGPTLVPLSAKGGRRRRVRSRGREGAASDLGMVPRRLSFEKAGDADGAADDSGSAACACAAGSESESEYNRIVAAASALDTAGHSYLGDGQFGEAAASYRRGLELKRKLLSSLTSDCCGYGCGGVKEREARICDENCRAAAGGGCRGLAADSETEGGDDRSGRCQSRRKALLASFATSMNNITYANQRAGNSTPSDTLEIYESSLSLKRAALGPNRNDDLSIARTLNNVGSAHYGAGRYVEALHAYAESRSIMVGILGPDHLDIATVRSNAGDALLASGDRNDEALVELREALRIRWEKLGPDHRKVIRLLEKIASSAASEGDGPGTGVGNGGMLVDYFSDDEADGGVGRVHREFGNLKVALLTDMDKVSTIGRELALDVVKERLAMLREIRSGEEVEQQQQERQDREVQEGEGGHVKCQVSAAHVQHVTDEGDHFDAAPTSTIAPLSDPSSSRQRSPCQRQREPPHIRSAHDGAVAVRDVRERLAKVQERRRRREQDL